MTLTRYYLCCLEPNLKVGLKLSQLQITIHPNFDLTNRDIVNKSRSLHFYRDVQVHFFRELDHSRSLPKKSEPRSLTFMNFYLVKI